MILPFAEASFILDLKQHRVAFGTGTRAYLYRLFKKNYFLCNKRGSNFQFGILRDLSASVSNHSDL